MAIPTSDLQEFLDQNKGYKLFKRLKDTTIIRLPSGELLKILDEYLLKIIADTGYNLDVRLDEADKFASFKNFSIPTRKLTQKGKAISYVMPYFPGVDFTDYYVDIFNLLSYAKLHSQIEGNIKEGNELGLVFPDLCTTENILVSKDGKVFFIDYDGIQIGNMPAVGYSDFLGTPEQVLTPKYYDDKTDLFTKELDIKSAIFLYFLDTFGVNLSTVGTLNPENGKIVTLDFVFQTINLEDPDIQQKVWLLFQEDKQNEFLGDSIYNLAEKYILVPDMSVGGMIKNLVRK